MKTAFIPTHSLRMRFSESCSVQHFVKGVLECATKRGTSLNGTNYAGVVMALLVRAQLELSLNIKLDQNIVFSGDTPPFWSTYFKIDNTVLYITPSPTYALICKCKDDLGSGFIPLIVTKNSQHAVAASYLAENENIGELIDVFDIGQFISTNIHEISRFDHETRRVTVEQLVEKYNAIVDAHETDPSLLLVIG